MLRILSFSLVVLFFFSCDSNNDKAIEPTVEIQSKELKNAILEYDSFLHSDSMTRSSIHDNDYLLTVYEKNINDTVTEFTISYSLDTWFLQDSPILLANVGEKDVIIYNVNLPQGILSTDKQLHKKIARRHFPKEYKLLEEGEPLNSMNTNHGPTMVLKYCNNKFVFKKMYTGF